MRVMRVSSWNVRRCPGALSTHHAGTQLLAAEARPAPGPHGGFYAPSAFARRGETTSKLAKRGCHATHPWNRASGSRPSPALSAVLIAQKADPPQRCRQGRPKMLRGCRVSASWRARHCSVAQPQLGRRVQLHRHDRWHPAISGCDGEPGGVRVGQLVDVHRPRPRRASVGHRRRVLGNKS